MHDRRGVAKERLDQALVTRGLCPSRTQAQRALLAGLVLINGRKAGKAGDPVGVDDTLALAETERYVSRGGQKLEGALAGFGLDVKGVNALDIGSSTGGFTDCLLQHLAGHVTAVDVGKGQLAWKLRQDSRVTVMEGVNARHVTAASFPKERFPFDFICADCSFISLKLVLPPAAPLLRPGGILVALIKPQFEAGREEADKGRGVIRDPGVHAAVLAGLEAFVASDLPTLRWEGCMESPLTGPAGNKEFLALLRRTP
jgi:23S rRNA (cytidine1920-2'-O)/16S rRNA (cytidine1409-2'-O)-methyltransferase